MLRVIVLLPLAETKSAFEMNTIQWGRVTCDMDEIQVSRSFGDQQREIRSLRSMWRGLETESSDYCASSEPGQETQKGEVSC